MLDVIFLTPKRVIFEGRAQSVVLPGEKGVCQILPFHKNFLSRILSGFVIIGRDRFHVKRGIIRVDRNRVTIIAEEQES